MKVSTYLSLALAGLVGAQDPSITEALNSNEDLSALAKLIASRTDIVKILSNIEDITVLAPSNDALNAFISANADAATDQDLIKAVLTYHVVNGTIKAADFKATPAFPATYLDNTKYENVTGGQVVEGAAVDGGVVITSGDAAESKVTKADIAFDKGVIHIIDKVLTIPQGAGATAKAAGLTSLVDALTTADLVSTVEGLSDITVFAPSNEAFEAIADKLKGASKEDVAKILQYHVVQGTVGYSSDLKSGDLKTVGGGSVKITVGDDGSVKVNDAKVTKPNVLIANGVVHVIDSVLMPEDSSSGSSSTTAAAPSGSATATATQSGSGSGSGSGGSGGSGSTGGSGGATATASGGAATVTAGASQQMAAAGVIALVAGAAAVYNGF